VASADVLSQTISSITAIRLDQLQKQQEAYEDKKRAVCENVASEVDTAKRAKKLLKGCEELKPFGLRKIETLSGLDKFFDQAEFDPSLTQHMLKEYEAEIHSHLRTQTNKYEFASLYGKLIKEWAAAGSSNVAPTTNGAGSVVVGREEMHRQRATWEEYAFKAKETDGGAIKAYLDDVFSSDEAKRALKTLRDWMKAFQHDWKFKTHFDEPKLEAIIEGILRTDILTDDKRATVRSFLGNHTVLSEIVDVLNMRMSALGIWTWDTPLIVEQRRNLNGRYRFHTDEDLLDSIFVYYIGMEWASELRTRLTLLIGAGGVWKPDTQPVSKSDVHRRCFFLSDHTTSHSNSVQNSRDIHFNEILLDQLPSGLWEIRDSYGDLEVEVKEETKASHIQVVQELLQRLQTEILMQTKLGREMTVIRSDFKWFGPSLPHSTIYAVLEFLGVDAEWTDFFRRVLEAEMRFKHDPSDTPARVRKRGTPIDTPLTYFLGESILFCLDYAVNQKADGTRLYRLHDDMWLWGSSEACGKAWSVITQFTDAMGLELNAEKTGCAQITKGNGVAESTPSSDAFPKGDIKWGFLKLEPVTGRFLINQEEVDKHIEELRLQLSACPSILDYIQAWNLYGSRFFANNFGRPANCYGRAHIDGMLATFRRVQEKLFPDHPGGVGEHLKHTIASRFGISPSDIPDGYLYWPTSMGGLGLQNPFITLLLARGNVEPEPEKLMDIYLEEEDLAYNKAKAKFEEDINNPEPPAYGRKWRDAEEYADLRQEPFMSREEFSRYRELVDPKLANTYKKLLMAPGATSVMFTGDVLLALPNDRRWNDLSDYDKWVVQLYHKDVIARFGGVDVVDRWLLPTGLISMLRESRFRWEV
jgi:hypothetical protein